MLKKASVILGTTACFLAPRVAEAREVIENYVELQALRYVHSNVTFDTKGVDGVSRQFKLASDRIRTFERWINFVGYLQRFAVQLTRPLDLTESGYFAVGYVVNRTFEAGWGVNSNYRHLEEPVENKKQIQSGSLLFTGPYAKVTVPVGFGDIELRWELDYGRSLNKYKFGDLAEEKLQDVAGFETDFDVRAVFEVAKKVDWSTGFNVYFRSLKNRAPNDQDAQGNRIYTESTIRDVSIGLNLVNLRYHF